MKPFNNGSIFRVTKTAARKAYEAGENVLFIPCELHPASMLAESCGMWQNKELLGQFDSFEKLVNDYTSYICDKDTGKYISFYLKAGRA